jgi:3-hydroxybutyryl-CoA dehydratase
MVNREIKVGDFFEKQFHITEELVRRFADISTDKNPIHLDESYAEKTFFKKRIAHGMLLGSFISAILGNDFPGNGTVYLSQSLEFKAPVYLNQIIKIRIQAVEVENKKIKLSTICSNEAGEVVLSGFASVKIFSI